MSAAAAEPEETVDFTVEVPEPDHTKDVVTFSLDGDNTVLTAHRPKRARLRAIVTAASKVDGIDEDGEAAIAYERMLSVMLDKPSLAYLESRWADDEDDLDLDIVPTIAKRLIGVWYGGPTGSPSGSAPSRKPSGGRSTGNARSKASTRST